LTTPPDCCLCGKPCEPWHAEPTGYGNNPDPLGFEGDRCCNDCNTEFVIPARIRTINEHPIPKQKESN
jgi:hypothetical protein